MAKQITGYEYQDDRGRWFYRVQYSDALGKRRNVCRLAKNKTAAKTEKMKAIAKLEELGDKAFEADRLKFSDLSGRFREKRVFPVQRAKGVKVGGYKSLAHVEMLLNTLDRNFGNRILKSITHSDIDQFKLRRLKELKSNGGERTIASVNRELEMLRALMNFAKRERWIRDSPFEFGEPLISKAAEAKRERTLSHTEEARLLDACNSIHVRYERLGTTVVQRIPSDARQRRSLLRAMIILAVDSGMRRGEIMKLVWGDVDFASSEITVKAANSKTEQKRVVWMTQRTRNELVALWQLQGDNASSRIFGLEHYTSSVKKAWKSVCELASITDLRFHDLRHTFVTRSISAGINASEVMKTAGHSQTATFLRYLNPTAESRRDAASQLEAFNRRLLTP